MSRKAFPLVELIVVVAVIGILAAVLWPVHGRGTRGDRRSMCQSNLKQIGLAFIQYQQDYDERFPPVAVVAKGNWAGSIQPYMKSWPLFQCPSASSTKPKTVDYFYNSRVANIDVKKFAFEAKTILAGEGANDSSTNYALSNLPAKWIVDESSPAYRHRKTANYLFVDGHVKAIAPANLKAPLSWNP